MTTEELIKKDGKICTKKGSCRACGTNKFVRCAFMAIKLLGTMDVQGVEKSVEETALPGTDGEVSQ